MDDNKELIGYMFDEISSIAPKDQECSIDYIQNDNDREEMLLILGEQSFQAEVRYSVNYVKGVRDAFRFFNKCELDRMMGKK